MSHPKDQKLSDLGKQLLALEFTTPLTSEAAPLSIRVESMEAENKLKGVRVAPGHSIGLLLLQSYIGGTIRTFGSIRNDLFKAARLADLLTFRFGHLRLQRVRETADPDYNYTKAQAAADYANERPIAAVVDAIAAYLTELGALLDPDNLPSAPVPVPRAPSSSTVASALRSLESRLANLETMITALYTKQIGPITPA